MTYMRRICSWCPKPHQFGAKCKCGAEAFSYGYHQSDRWHCLKCGDFFKLPENAPETHGMCPRAEAEWKLKNLPKRTAMHARHRRGLGTSFRNGLPLGLKSPTK